MSKPPGRYRLAAPGLILALLLAGCGPQQQSEASRCPEAGGTPSQVVELFFGRSMPDHREVTEAAWNRFVDEVVTPNLPDGFTIFDAVGAWRDPHSHVTAREPTKVLLAAIPPGRLGAVQRVRSEYQQRFRQVLVGMIVQPACTAF